MKLDIKAFGLACGIVWGMAMLSIGILDMFSTFGEAIGSAMSTVYWGYKPTIIGSIIGGLWGFCDAGIGGVCVAWIYNKLSKQ